MTTFPLSAGTDNVAGTANPDLITGKSTEWQAADTLNGGNGADILQITAVSAATAAVIDGLFQKVSSVETLALLGSFAETVTLGTLSDAAGLFTIDGSGLTGVLSVDASARAGGIAIDSSKGVNTLTGTADDDTFRFTSAGLTSADTVNGGGMGDTDTIQITDKSAVTDKAFTHVSHVERLALGGGGIDYTGQKVTLGALSINAGIKEVVVLDSQGATLDATARVAGVTFKGNSGDDIFKASQGNDTFLGGGGADSYQVKAAQFTFGDAIDGDIGRDEIRIMDAGTPIADVAFAAVQNVETLVFNDSTAQTVNLGSFADDAGLDTIDASKLTGSFNLTLANTFKNTVEIKLGTGADTLQLGNGGGHTVTLKSTSLTSKDTLVGNTGGNDSLKFTDAVKLSDKYFQNATGVDNFGVLFLENPGKGQSLVAGDAFKAFVTASDLKFVFADVGAKDTSFTFDFSQYTGNQIFVIGSGGSDTFIAGAVDLVMGGAASSYDLGMADTFRFKSAWYNATDMVSGGKSTADVLSIMDTAIAIVDADFTNTSKVEQLRLEKGAANTTYQLTLGTKFDLSGIAIVDAGKAAVNVQINAGATQFGHTYIAGAKDNILTGGSGMDVFQFDAKTFNGSDMVTGGTSGSLGDTLRFSTGGAIAQSSLANVSGIEVYELSSKGNSIAVTDVMIASAETIMRPYNGFNLGAHGLIVTGGGKDTVDLSQLTTWAGDPVVIGSAGGDKYTGSFRGDLFVFQKSSDLTAATQIDAGAGNDTLFLAGGTYTAAQFKGVKHVDQVMICDADPAAAFNLSFDNTFFANTDKHSLVVLAVTPLTGPLTVDASAVTDPLASLGVLATAGNDVLKGTAGNDLFHFDSDVAGNFYLDKNDVVQGGAGMDTITFSNGYAGPVFLTGTDLAGVSGVETLVVSTGFSTDFSCFMDFQFQAKGIAEINGGPSQGKLAIDASIYTTAVTLHGGNNDDTLTGGSAGDTFVFDNQGIQTATLTANDAIDGKAGINRILFNGDATLTNADFLKVSHIQSLVLENGVFSVTLGANTDTAGIVTVDASEATGGASVIGVVSNKNLTLLGSDQLDLLAGGAGVDHITGGKGGDVLYGLGGNDVFVYQSAADSRQLAGNNLTKADAIQDWNTGDLIDISALKSGAVSVFNHGTVVNFITTDTANWFGANDVAVAYDSNNTRVYVDANHDGSFNLNQDVVIQVVGNHLNDVATAATYV